MVLLQKSDAREKEHDASEEEMNVLGLRVGVAGRHDDSGRSLKSG